MIGIVVLVIVGGALLYGVTKGAMYNRRNTYDLDKQFDQMERERRKQLKQLRKNNKHLNAKGK